MKRKPITELQAAEVFQHLVDTTSDLSCEQAEALLPDLVEAEQAGIDVDADPRFVALLAHLDDCDNDCMDTYLALSEDLKAQVGAEGRLTQERPNLKPFFGAEEQEEHFLVRLINSVKRQFEVIVNRPHIGAPVAALGSGPKESLFFRTLTSIPGAPTISAVMDAYGDPPTITVAIRESGTTTRWRVQLQVGDQFYTALTDQRGNARLTGFSLEQLQAADTLQLTYSEDQIQ